VAVFIKQFGGGIFSDVPWMFVCSRRSISCITLGGPQFDLRPVEAPEGANNAKSDNVGKNRACRIINNLPKYSGYI
jgi:hypothetical protein